MKNTYQIRVSRAILQIIHVMLKLQQVIKREILPDLKRY